jgi:hypothetical protein
MSLFVSFTKKAEQDILFSKHADKLEHEVLR